MPNDSTMKFKADISQLRAAMQQAGRAIRVANSEFKAATAGMDDWNKSADGLQAKLKQLNTVLKSQKTQLTLTEQELQKTVAAYGENSAEADRVRIKLNNQTAAIKKTESELSKYETALDEVQNGAEDMGDSIEDSAKKAQKASDGFTVMKGALASLVADGIRLTIGALKDLGKETFNAGANFESAMSQVEAVSGASADDIERLTDKAKEMGARTKFSATESAEAFNYMAMAGWKTEDMLGGIEGIMNLAAASGSDLATTSDIVTDALTAMGYSAKDAGRLADVMAAASSNANTNVEMMGQTFQYAAPIVGALGYNMEDTAVAIGMMANAGIKGEKAGTALRSILTRLSAPPKECAQAMEELDLSITNADGTMKPFVTVMQDLRKKFKGLSESQQTQLAKSIAGQEAMSGLLAVVNGAETDFKKLTKAVKESEGAAQDMADTMNDNVSGQLTLLKSQIEGEMIKVFEKAAPQIRKAIETISNALENVNWDTVAAKVGEGVQKVVDLFSWLIRNGSSVSATLKVIGGAMAGIFVTSKAVSFAQVITGIPAKVALLEKGTLAAAVATKALAVAQAALPLVAVAGGIAAITGALYLYNKKQEEAARAEYKLTEEQQKSVKAVEESRKAIDELTKARNESIANASGEYNYLSQLVGEYNGLINANGKVKKGYEDRAEFILTTLANSLGVERSEIEKNIGKNGELKKSINELIETQRAQAYLSANEESYKNAIANKDAAIQEYGAALRTLDEAETKYRESQQASAQVLEDYNELLKVSPDHAVRYKQAHSEVFAANDEAKASYEKAQKAVKDAEQNYIDYNNTIANYEGLSAAIISGDQKKISEALKTMQNDFITSNNGTREVLEQQVKDFEEKYYNMQAAVNAGMPGVTQAEVDAMGKLVEQAKAELDKLPPEAEKSGEKAGDAHASGVKSTESTNKTAAKGVKDATTKELEKGTDTAKKAGQKAGKARAKGVESTKKENQTAAKNVASAGNKELDKEVKNTTKKGEESTKNFAKGQTKEKGKAENAAKSVADGSNSKLKADTYSSGQNFIQGYINGINSMKTEAYNKAYSVGKSTHEGLKKGQKEGSPSKLTYQSGVYFVQGYINGISSMQTQLVKTIQGMVKSVVKELGKLDNFNFTEVAQNASTKFANSISAQTSYMLAKMQYQNEARLKDFDNTISKLEKERDNKVKALEKKETKKNKKSIQKQITAVKNQYTKLINTQNQYKTAYQNASSQMLSEFQTAINQYQTAAQKLIDDTINGITDKYNTRYNELISKQDTLIEKLKGAGDLFEVSGAGVMTVNDIKEQTKQIKDYTNKLAAIKKKVSSELFDEIASYDMKEGGAFINRLLSMSESDLNAYNDAYTEKIEAAQKAAESIYKSDFNKVASDYEKELDSAFDGIEDQLKTLGNQAMKGFVDGLTKNTDYMDKNVKTFVKSMVDTFKKELKIKSPSKVMFGIGEFTGEGFDNGLMSVITSIQETATRIADAVATPIDDLTADISGVRSSVNQGGVNGVYGTNNNVVNNYNLVQNNTSPKALTALETYQARRRQIALAKAATQNA